MPVKDNYSRGRIFSNPTRRKFKPFRSLTRLVVGGAILGIEELMDRLETWEREIEQEPVDVIPAETDIYDAGAEPPQSLNNGFQGVQPLEDSVSAFHVLVGLIFDTQTKVERRLSALGQFERRVSKRLLAPFKPLVRSRLANPTNHRFENLVRRGEKEVARLAEIGKVEEYRSRKLALTATTDTVDSSIDYLADNEELQELITAQGIGLAGEVLEELRERTVSADDFFERLVRGFLRRTPRDQLEASSPEVRDRAVHIRSPEDKK